MVYFRYFSPRVISFYGETVEDLELMPTTTKIGQGEYVHALAPEGSYARLLTPDGLRIYMLRSTGWVDVTASGSGGGGSGGTSGTTNYDNLTNKPKINGVTLKGDISFSDLGLRTLSEEEINNIWNNS